MTKFNRKKWLRVGHYLIVLFLCVCTGFLLLNLVAATVPRSAIREKTLESAKYMAAHNLEFEHLRKDFDGSRVDRYADSITLMITYNLDENDTVNSSLWSAYTETGEQLTGLDLLEQTENDIEPNYEYLRYWHGSSVYLRPMLMYFNIQQIYVINAMIMVILWIILIYRLVRHDETVLAVCFSIALMMVYIWVVPYALEYTWMFLLMFIVMHVCVSLVWRNRQKYLPMMFMLIGAAAAYLDFLTVETITLGMPLLFIIWNERRLVTRKNRKEFIKRYIGYALIWLVGFATMWVGKWVLCSIAFGPQAWEFVGYHLEERSIQNDWYGSTFELIYNVLWRNFVQLMPTPLNNYGIVPMVALILASVVLLIFYRKKSGKAKIGLFLWGAALIPIVRMLVLVNHAHIHFFFTYRALSVFLLAMMLLVVNAVDWNKFGKSIKQYLPTK